MRVYIKVIISLLAIISGLYSSLSLAQKPVLVLFPVEVDERDDRYSSDYGSALQEGLQSRYQVFYGPAVEAELQKEYEKVDCNAELCNQNVAIAFNGELIARASARRLGDGYIVKLVTTNIFTNEIVESQTHPCRNCDGFAVIDAFKVIGRGQGLATARPNTNNGISLLDSNPSGAETSTGAEPAVLIFDSQPSGATVTINGSNAGKTPYQGLDHIMGDVLTISLSKEFYKPLRFKAELNKEFTRIKQAFVLEQGSGQLLLSFKPYQAEVMLWEGDTNHGELPLRLNLSAGPHQFQARLKNKVLAEGSASISDGSRQQLVLENAVAQLAPLTTTSGSINMVSIPAGSFSMGSNSDSSDEKPVHRVNINAFNMSQTEVTFAQWDACVSAGGCKHKPKDKGWGRANRPVMNVSYNDITQQFIPWLNKRSGKHFRLPTEAEWEYAARAGSTTKYSWGDSIDCSKAQYDGGESSNCYYKKSNGDYRGTARVGSFKANAFGLYDMHGNVWEWVADCYEDSYSGAPSNGNARTQCEGTSRVLRGGSWFRLPADLRSSYRYRFSSANRSIDSGFRLAQDL